MANLKAEGNAKGRGVIPVDDNQIFTIGYDDSDISEVFQGLRTRIQDLSPLFVIWGEYMLLATDERYVRQVDPFGIPWKANSARTIALKAALGRINMILQSSGLMRRSYSYRASNNQVEIGTNDPKAAKHQFGIGVAKRVHLGVSQGDLAEMKMSFISYVVDNDKSRRFPSGK